MPAARKQAGASMPGNAGTEVDEVQLSIVGRNIDITDAIKDYVEKRLQKLKKYFPYVVDVHVVLYTQKINQVCEVTILANRFTIHGEERSGDLYASIDLVVDKLDSQLKRYKERLVDKHERQQRKEKEKELNLNISVYDRGDLEDLNPEPQVIHTQRLAIKPMSVEEAVMQMDLINQDFLVFRNDASDGINVIYRRKDGHYGLIVPEIHP